VAIDWCVRRELVSVVFIGAIMLLSAFHTNLTNGFSTDSGVFHEDDAPSNMNSPYKGTSSILAGHFIQNAGQIERDDIYFMFSQSPTAFLESSVLITVGQGAESTTITVSFHGSNNVLPIGMNTLDHTSTFILGSEHSDQFHNVPSFQRILYKDLYDGIDLVYYGTSEGLKYDFIVGPYADPSRVRVTYESTNGICSLYREADGTLGIVTNAGTLREGAPFAYQKIRGQVTEIAADIEIKDSTVSYVLGDYDRSAPLTIDPLIYGTFIGGSEDETGFALATDNQGNVYVAGWTDSKNFPVTNDSFNQTHNDDTDVFVFKLNPLGTEIVFSTYIGGKADEGASDILVAEDQTIYVTGDTYSSDFPTTNGSYDEKCNKDREAFVLHLDANGSSLIFSTFLGGGYRDYGSSIALDSIGNVCVAGHTESSNFPTTPGCYDDKRKSFEDGFVCKLNPNGSKLLYSSIFGGQKTDWVYDLVVDSMDNMIVTGYTTGGFPTTARAYSRTRKGTGEVFISRFNHNLSKLLASTFVGGNQFDAAHGIAIDVNDNVYVTGYTGSSNFPTTKWAYDKKRGSDYDVFVLKMPVNLSSLIYSTFIGGNNYEKGHDIAVNQYNEAYVTGYTKSTNYPTSDTCYSSIYAGGDADGFITVMNWNGSDLRYSSYIGGTDTEWFYGIALDQNNDAFVTGYTRSKNLPYTENSFDPKKSGPTDAFAIKINITMPKKSSGGGDSPGLLSGDAVLAITFATVCIPHIHLRRQRKKQLL